MGPLLWIVIRFDQFEFHDGVFFVVAAHQVDARIEEVALDRLERGRETGRLRDDVPTEVLLDYLDLVLDGLITRLASGRPTDDLSAVLDLVEASVRSRATAES